MPAKRILRAMFVEAATAAGAELPADLRGLALARVRGTLLFLAAFFTLTIPLRWLTWGKAGGRALAVVTVVSATVSVLSLVTWALLRFAKLPAKSALAAGLVYEVWVCFALAMVEQVLVGQSPMPFRLSLVAIFLLVFPLVIPSPPRWRLITTATCAATAPFAIALAQLLSGAVHPRELVLASVPTVVVGVLAMWLGQVVHRLRVAASQGEALGQYELVKRIGEGGMGEVWEARHAQLLRPAAVKLIRAETAGAYGDAARARFRREAQATSALRSPHTVELYDFGLTDDGTLYYAMELLDGLDLETLVKRFGPMHPGRVLHVLEGVARSLAEAHDLGLVHRDIKPANLYLCRVGIELDFVKLLDFGLVKPRTLAEDSPVSLVGAISGTPGYVAPEHAAGEPLDGRADLYSLGCVAYYLVTGKRVFHRGTKASLLAAHRTEDPIRPSLRAPERDIPEALDEIIMSLLCRDRERRPGNARHLLRLVEEASATCPKWTRLDTYAWWSAHLGVETRPELVL